ncbi:hypothetical protein HYV91_00550 [Candidatus Wolfebacteria bacterium]|nr:hypothetical protein [Candidatus Wolfebacteria bacterium]
MGVSTKFFLVGVLLLVVGLGVGYWYGTLKVKISYQTGYDQALADAKTTQEEVGKKAAEEAAKAANPFQVANPLEGVKANPFSDAQKALNPFAE